MNVLRFEKPKPKKPCLLCQTQVETTAEHKLVFCSSCLGNDWLKGMIEDACVGEYIKNLPPGAGIYKMEGCEYFTAFIDLAGKPLREFDSSDPEIALHDLFTEAL